MGGEGDIKYNQSEIGEPLVSERPKTPSKTSLIRDQIVVEPRATISQNMRISGVGMHTGKKATVTVYPNPGNGIVFVRNGKPTLACPENVSSTFLSTSIGEGEHKVQTIEHIMSALWGVE